MQLTDPVLHPVYLAFVLDERDAGWIDRDPSSLRELVASIGPTSQVNWNKIQAAKTVRCGHAPYDDFRVFNFVVRALGGRTPNFLLLEPPSVPEMVGGAQMMGLLSLGSDKVFDAEVLRYAAVVSDYNGAGPLPEPLQGTKDYVKVPVRNPGLVEAAKGYVADLNTVLMIQMESASG